MNNIELKKLKALAFLTFAEIKNECGVYKIKGESFTYLAIVNTGAKNEVFYIYRTSSTTSSSNGLDFANECWETNNFTKVAQNTLFSFDKERLVESISVKDIKSLPRGFYYDSRGRRYIKLKYISNYILTKKSENGLFLCNPHTGLTRVEQTTVTKFFLVSSGLSIRMI